MPRMSRRAFVRTTSVSAGAALAASPLLARTGALAAAGASLQDWGSVRELFDLAPGRVHATLFYLSSHPRPVREAIEKMRRLLDANPFDAVEEGAFGGPDHNLTARSLAAIARYIGARPEEITFTNSTTHGLALVYQGLPLGPGDEILTSAHDHFSHLETVRLVAERSGATARRVALFAPHDASAATTEGVVRTLREAISPATRVLGLTWVHSSCGFKMPLRAMADAVREVNERRDPAHGITIVVDGVHGLGADDPRVAETGVDVFVSGLHKWMLGPRGTGLVWARAETWARMRPLIVSYQSADLYQAWMERRAPAPPAHASWFGLGGFQAYEHVWAVAAAVELHEAIGPARIAARIAALNGRLREQLAGIPHVRLRTPRDPALSAGITAFEVDGLDAGAAVEKLRGRNVIGSASPYPVSYPRLSFGIANNEADVEAAVAAVRTLRP